MSEAVAAHHHEEHLSTGIPNKKILMWAFLASDCMFFGTLISTHILYRGRSLTGPYPIDVFEVNVTTVSSFVLLMSSLLMVLAVDAIRRQKIGQFRLWVFLTAVFGSIFLGFQSNEFTTFFHEGLSPQTNLFGTTFFTMTGTHGLHVTIGVIWLLGWFIYSFFGDMSDKALDIDVMGLYWHFVDIVWIVIFTVVYLLEFIPLVSPSV